MLRFTDFENVIGTKIIYIRIKMGTMIATRNFGCNIRTIICLLDIVRRIHIHISITIRILTGSIMVNIFRAIESTEPVIGTCFIIKSHVFGRT